MSLRSTMAALLGISAYALPSSDLPGLDSPQVEQIREAMGGQIQNPPFTQTRWYLSDLEAAEHAADQGNMTGAARLMRSANRDGVLAGVISTRTDGLVRLPKRFRGRDDILAALEVGHNERDYRTGQGAATRSVFDEMCPASELALLAGDGIKLGVGVAELVPVEGRDYPILIRLDPEFLWYRWNENRWYFRSIAGMIPITPGDGRWVLHTPGGRTSPWHNGLWRALGRAYIRKEHANLYKDNWEAKLANPARVAYSPNGSTEAQLESWFSRVLAWGVNTVFGLKPGYEVKLLESNGRGADSFRLTVQDQNSEIIIAVAGQTVTTDGGAGFANADIHKSIRADLIKATADTLAYTVNTQILPPFIAARWDEAAAVAGAVMEWDVTPPADRTSEASAISTAATALTTLTAALAERGYEVDIEAYAARFGIPLLRAAEASAEGGKLLELRKKATQPAAPAEARRAA